MVGAEVKKERDVSRRDWSRDHGPRGKVQGFTRGSLRWSLRVSAVVPERWTVQEPIRHDGQESIVEER